MDRALTALRNTVDNLLAVENALQHSSAVHLSTAVLEALAREVRHAIELIRVAIETIESEGPRDVRQSATSPNHKHRPTKQINDETLLLRRPRRRIHDRE